MNFIKNHFAYNKKSYILLAMIYICGLAVGTVGPAFCTPEQLQDTMLFMQGFFQKLSIESLNSTSVLLTALCTQLRNLAVLILLGLTAAGVPAVLIITGIKGFSSGFAIGMLLRIYGAKSLLITGLAILPAAIIYLPAYGYISTEILNAASLKHSGKSLSYTKRVQTFLNTVLPGAGLILTGILTEAYLVPFLLKWISPLFQ